jgi:aspartate/methionine/tyrosine aminotransferase
MRVSDRGMRIDPFRVMEVMKAAARRAETHGDVIRMEVGQPSTGAPRLALEAAQRAMARDPLGYTDAFGTSALRAAISDHYKAHYHIDVPPERIVVTTGSSSGFLLSFLAAFDAGNRVAIAEPGYPAYRNIMAALSLDCVPVPVGPNERFRLSPENLAAAGPLDGVLVASPANPTGTMLTTRGLRDLVADCEANGRWLIVDEIYHGITYGEAAETVLELTDRAIVINSFSKYFSMTGWRLGWMVLPHALIRAVECLAQNLFISPPGVSQAAAIGALAAREELDGSVRRYAANRDLLLNELPSAGFDRFAPADGAFYLYADVSRFTEDSVAFCKRMLDETGIAATPGIDFDRARGKHFMRFSFAGATADMAEAAKRLKAWKK